MTFFPDPQSARAVRAHRRLAVQMTQARLRRGWTQKSFADQDGISVRTVRRLERGDTGVALPLVMSSALRLGLLREFNRLLECRTPGNTGTQHTMSGPFAMDSIELSPEVKLLLPQANSGPRLGDHMTITLAMGHQEVLIGELRQRNVVSGHSGKSKAAKAIASATVLTPDPSWLEHQRSFMPSHGHLGDGVKQKSMARNARTAAHRDVLWALADTVPSGFGVRVIKRAREQGLLGQLRSYGQRNTALDDLCPVLDIARLGALRVSPCGQLLSDAHADRLLLPRLGDLSAMAAAAWAFEQGKEDLRQLLLLTYAATAVGGQRPKCTSIDAQDRLIVAKFASALDTWAVNRGEVLAMYLAKKAGIDVVDAKLLHPVRDPILLTLRLDRREDGTRGHFLSAHSLLCVSAAHAVDHLDLLLAMQRCCVDFRVDGPKLWKRLVFKRLIQDASEDLRKIGFLYAGRERWKLAPACGLRPRPSKVNVPHGDQAHVSSQRLTLQTLVEQAEAFGVDPSHVRPFLRHQLEVLSSWKQSASEFFVSMNAHDIQQMGPAMNNPQMQWAKQLLTS